MALTTSLEFNNSKMRKLKRNVSFHKTKNKYLVVTREIKSVTPTKGSMLSRSRSTFYISPDSR